MQKTLDPTLEAMEAMALKKYRVEIVAKVEKHFTIFARTPDDAIQKINEGFGRPSGETGPDIMGFRVGEHQGEMKDFDPPVPIIGASK